MADRGNDRGWGENLSQQYTPEQVEAVLLNCGVDVDYDTAHDFVCYCPFHGNTHSPSFSVSRTSGSYICFNGSCNETGNLVELVKKVTKKGEFEARRLIAQAKTDATSDFSARLKKALSHEPEFIEFPQRTIDRLVEEFWATPKAIEYMHGRGFEDATLKEFEIGYSGKQGLITVPMHNATGMPIGVIGRTPSDDDKRFKNSPKLPTSKTLYNIHRAKKFGGVGVVVEASFDVQRVSQAGHGATVGCLGGNMSPFHLQQLDRYFDTIVIMTDFDKKQFTIDCARCRRNNKKLCVGHNPGRDLGMKIATGLPHKRVLWASYESRIVFPHDAKDPGQITDAEIRQCIKNAVTNFEYQSWNLY